MKQVFQSRTNRCRSSASVGTRLIRPGTTHCHHVIPNRNCSFNYSVSPKMRIISMNVTLPMTGEEEANLMAKARVEATTPEDLIRTAIEPLVAADPLQPAHAGKAET